MIDTNKKTVILNVAAGDSARHMTAPADQRDIWRKRDFAEITDATTLILKRIGYPLKRRNFICALQGIANSREEFQASHHVIARRLGHRGKQESAEQATYRELQALRKFQFESGIILFDIEPGGGEKERRRTMYFDYLIRVALRLRNRAADLKQSNPEYKKAPLGQVMESIVETAVAELPPYAGSRIAAHVGSPKAGRRRRQPAKPESDATDREQVWQVIAACLDQFAARDDGANLRHFAGQLTAKINETVERIIASSSGGENANLSAMVTSPSPLSFTASLTRRERERDEKGDHGLLFGSPSDYPHSARRAGSEPVQPPPAPRATDVTSKPNSPQLETALRYACRGWLVLPLHAPDERGSCSCGKGNVCHSPGKHPRTRRGVSEATRDADQIKSWWTAWPGANVGIATGEPSGIVCLDIDPRNGGDETLQKLLAEFGELPPTYSVATGGGGQHFYFQFPALAGGKLAGKLGAGLDIKSTGGYVVAAPSRHASGGIYRVENWAEAAPLPDWILARLTAGSQPLPSGMRQVAPEEPTGRQSEAITMAYGHGRLYADGIRNEKLFKIGCAMRGRGESESAIAGELLRTNELRCAPPLETDEVMKIIRNTLRYERNAN